MIEGEISKLYIRLAFQYESAIDMLLAKGLIDKELATAYKEHETNPQHPLQCSTALGEGL